MITAAKLKAATDSLVGSAGTVFNSNENETGRWLEFALAAEELAGASTSANDTISGYMKRAAVALESIAGTSGAEENTSYSGYLKRIVDALEVQVGATGTGSFSNRLTTAAAAAQFSSYTQTRVAFDGGDRIHKDISASLATGTAATISVWIDLTGMASGTQTDIITIGAGVGFMLSRSASNKLWVQAYNTSGVRIVSKATDALHTTGLVHVAVSVDTGASPAVQFYVNGVSVATGAGTLTAGDINFPAVGSSVIGALTSGGANPFTGALGDLWFDTSLVDLSTNINKFISGGNPVDLGTNGSTPTGSQPKLFFGGSMVAADWNAGNQLGSIGNGWTVVGAVV